MTEERVQLDEGIHVFEYECGKRWVLTGELWLPFGCWIEIGDDANYKARGPYKVARWFGVAALADPDERDELLNYFYKTDLPPDRVLDEAVRIAPNGRLFRLREAKRWI